MALGVELLGERRAVGRAVRLAVLLREHEGAGGGAGAELAVAAAARRGELRGEVGEVAVRAAATAVVPGVGLVPAVLLLLAAGGDVEQRGVRAGHRLEVLGALLGERQPQRRALLGAGVRDAVGAAAGRAADCVDLRREGGEVRGATSRAERSGGVAGRQRAHLRTRTQCARMSRLVVMLLNLISR